MATQGYNVKDNNPFYNQVSRPVQNEVNARSRKYSERERGGQKGDPIHAWLYRKTGYIKISRGNETLLEPPKGGFQVESKNGESTLYTRELYPKPVVNSVRISNEGDYGSLMKADINFTVFTLAQLNTYLTSLLTVEPLKQNGSNVPVKIEYGWTTVERIKDNVGSGPKEAFYGFVTNFSWTLRADGGFDCVSNLVGEGFFSLNTNSTPSNTKNANKAVLFGQQVAVDSDGNGPSESEVIPYNWVQRVKNATGDNAKFPIDSISPGLPGPPAIIAPNNGIAKLSVKLSNAQSENTDKVNAATPAEIVYVTLEWICFAVSKILQNNAPGLFPENAYQANKDISVGRKYTDIVSSNPRNILLPGYSVYGTESLTKSIDDKISMNQGNSNTVDLSKILVSIDFLMEMVKGMQSEVSAKMNSKDVDTSLVNFFGKIFTEINNCTGGLYQLSLVNPRVDAEKGEAEYKKSLSQWVVMETQFIGDSVEPFTIPVIISDNNTKGSVVRSMSMTSKLPGAMATAQFVSAASTLTGKTPQLIGAKTGTTPTPVKTSDETLNDLNKTKKTAFERGFRPDDVANIQSGLQDYKKYVVDQNSNEVKGSPLPIDLTVVMDGIRGFRFGNTIRINYLPKGYDNVVFTVTKIEHNIANNDWTTTLSTVSRLKV
jgi:hypothetical protein